MKFLWLCVAKRLGIKGVKTLQAEYLFSLVREKKITYGQIKELDPKRFADLEYTMKLIFNHDEEAAAALFMHPQFSGAHPAVNDQYSSSSSN